MSFAWYEAMGIFVLWFAQLLVPPIHVYVTAIYFGWCLIEIGFVLAGRKKFRAFGIFAEVWRTHVTAPRGRFRR